MPTTQTDLFNSTVILGGLKVIVLIILIFYAIFSLMIVRQVDLMSKTLLTNVSGILKLIAFANALFSIGLIVLTFIML